MKLGVALPIVDIGGEPAALREFAQAAEEIGYHGIAAPDHVLGVNVASRPGWTQGRGRSTDFYHDPFVLFGFLAGCTKIADFSTQVLILAQRQTVLVAKQAACLDVLSGGRFRLGIGVGWNEVEFIGLNENFHNRGRRSEEQVAGHESAVGAAACHLQGQWHTIEDAGINPLPTGAQDPALVRRSCRRDLAPLRQMGRRLDAPRLPAGRRSRKAIATLHRYAEEAGRDPATIGIDTRVSAGVGNEHDWRDQVQFWKSIGVTHLTLANYYESGHLHRIAGRSIGDHIEAMRRYWNAVADLL